jgi:hypothetical protein
LTLQVPFKSSADYQEIRYRFGGPPAGGLGLRRI